MTAIAPTSATPVRSRTLGVVRLQFINRHTYLWTPLIVLSGAWVITMLVIWMIHQAGGENPVVVGGTQAPMWYFLVVGVYAMTLSFPFSQAMSLTRREFFLGSLLAAAISATGLALVFVALGLIERVTDGYGFNGHFAYFSWIWAAGPAAAWLFYFVVTMLAFILGFWCATVFKRYGALALTAVLVGLGVGLVGLGALATWQEWWGPIAEWLAGAGALGLTLWGILLAAVLAGGSYLTLRRMPA